MGKKLTYEFVKASFEEDGYKLLSKEYKNNSTKLEYECPKGHEHSITWSDWKSGYRCPYCAGRPILTIEYIRAAFEREDYILLSTDYVNNHTKLDYVCPKGHKHSIRWNNWNEGQRCPYCAGKAKHTIEDIRQSFEEEGYTLLSTVYTNNSTKLDYTCQFGHSGSIRWHDWQQGKRCRTCAIVNLSGSGSPHWKGGKSLEPYCQLWGDKEFKQDIRERDGNCCLNPYCYGNDNLLSIHHIDYNKKNCHPSNLITVCRSCNSRANKDRRWHKAWYKAIIKNRYGSIYYGK